MRPTIELAYPFIGSFLVLYPRTLPSEAQCEPMRPTLELAYPFIGSPLVLYLRTLPCLVRPNAAQYGPV